MSYETLKTENENSILTITVNRPEKMNALSLTVLSEFKQVLNEVKNQKDFAIKGVILTGEGEKAFIAGADIKAMSQMSPEDGEHFGQLGQDVARLLETVPVPVIACVNGFALGGGCEMAMGADFIYATQNAIFGQPEVNLGLIPGFGGCVRLFRKVGPGKAKELIYSGRNLKSQEALDIGLVNEVFESREDMINGAKKILSLMMTKSPYAISICKEVMNSLEGKTISEGENEEKKAFRRVFESEDKKEGVAAFLEKRRPDFQGK